MSSFIHSAKHFNSIETVLIENYERFMPYSFYNNISPIQARKKVKNLVTELRNINVLAVCLQYAHHYGNDLNNQIQAEIEAVNKETDTIYLSKVELIKALQSVSYQIEIEHIKAIRDLTESEAEAMKFLQDAINGVANAIIYDLPEYDEAKTWSI